MRNEVVWKVGGQQGEGIDSTGEIFALALARKGYYISSNKHFASRIKGVIPTIKFMSQQRLLIIMEITPMFSWHWIKKPSITT